jgi:hypothetical protein
MKTLILYVFHEYNNLVKKFIEKSIFKDDNIDFMIICKECIPNKDELANILSSTNKQIIEISLAQLNQFAGNVLEVLGTENTKYLVMSEQAFKVYTPAQIQAFEKHCTILHSPLYAIETNGGGSARCMMAEVFLKLKDKK